MNALSNLNTHGFYSDPRENQLLAVLPAADLERWRPYLEMVAMPSGSPLCHAGESPTHVYFPTTASVSIQQITHAGASVEIAAIGHEGMVGVPVIMGGGSTPSHAVVRATGYGFRMGSQCVRSEFRRSEAVMRLLLLYGQALMTQTSQTALCNLHHTLDQRLCRCLLMSMDRLHGPSLSMTHEGMAGLLGVRREGVTSAALKLQRAGVIEYARGRVKVLDRGALEAQSCECYEVVTDEYRRLLPQACEPCVPARGQSAPVVEKPAWQRAPQSGLEPLHTRSRVPQTDVAAAW